MLDEHVIVEARKIADGRYEIKDCESGIKCIISYNQEGRMLFDGEDIETEDFMSYVGMLDTVDDSPNKAVRFNADMTAEDL